MSFSRWLAMGALAAVVSTAAQAQEQQADCTCVAAPAGASAAGLVTEAKGDVMMSSREGFAPPVSGQQFAAGTEFVLGCEAAASIRVGQDCNLALQPGSQVSVVSQDGNFCVRTVDQSALCGEGGSLESASGMHEGRPHFGLPEALFVGAVGTGAAVGFALGNGDSPASP